MSTRTKIIIVAVGWALLALWAFIDANTADADDHGMVVTCDDVRVWDVRNLGDVAVHRTGGTDRYRPGNALTVPAVTSEGAVTFIDTDHHDYTVTVPACLPATTTTSTTTTTVPPSSTTTTTEAPTASPPVSSTTTVPAPPVTPSTPGPDTPPLPGPGPSLPTAPPATPVAETPRFTG